MLSGITIGQYFPGRSLVHRMDPRVKLVLTFAYIVAVFIPRNWVGMGLAAGFLVFSVALSRLPLKLVWKSVKPILPLVLFTSVINIFFVDGGDILVDWWIFHITVRGVVTAVFIALRIVCLIAGSSLLTYTTSPTTLTDALERLMKPLKLLHVHVHEIAMMMTIALRFIPTLLEEADKIMKAQMARGADFESGNLLARAKAMVPLLVPLFVSAFRRAGDLAMAMESRCYRGGEGRTRLRVLKLTRADLYASLVMAAFVGLIVIEGLVV